MKVLVIGAGPTGLTAALALAKQNIPCRIVELRTKPSKLSRAVGIMPMTIDMLRTLDAADAIVSEAIPIRSIHLTRSGKTLMFLDNTIPQYRDRVIVGLPQNRTEEILRETLKEKGIDVEYGIAAENISTNVQSADVSFSDNTKQSYDWVIAADGVSSIVRKQLGIAYPGHDLPGEWSIADVEVSGDFDYETVQIDVQAAGNKFLMILPIEKRRVRIVSSTPDALAAMTLPLNIDKVRRTGAFEISIRQADTYQKGRVLLAGDAAHCHSPLGGKGMNLGMADAVAAVAAITDGTVASYSKERHALGAKIIKSTEGARKMVTSNNVLAKTIFGLTVKLIASVPFVRRKFMKNLTEL